MTRDLLSVAEMAMAEIITLVMMMGARLDQEMSYTMTRKTTVMKNKGVITLPMTM